MHSKEFIGSKSHEDHGLDSEASLSFAEMIDLDSIDDQDIKDLIIKERAVPVAISTDEGIRPKIIDSCGMTCSFCHNEGTPVASAYSKTTLLPNPRYRGGRVSIFEKTNNVDFIPGTMQPDDNFLGSLLQTKQALGIKEVHLTGGEPTLHPMLPQIVAMAARAGLDVKMTSNGENGKRQIAECANAGLSKINFSIFGTTPEELAMTQHERYQNPALAARKLNALHESINEALIHGLKVDANIVMPSLAHADRVARILDRYGEKVTIRIQNDLDNQRESRLAIYKFLAMVNAEPEELRIDAGTSDARVRYRMPTGEVIIFKQIRKTMLPETCGDCTLNNPTDCKEGYYGTRLYVDTNGKYKIGICLLRMDLTQDIDDFINSTLPGEILQHREKELSLLKQHYRDRLIDTDRKDP